MKRALLALGMGLFVLNGSALADHLNKVAATDAILLEGYHVIQTALAKDEFGGAKTGANDLIKASQDWIANAGAQHPQLDNVKKILKGSETVSEAKEAKEYRERFGVLSEGVVEFIKKDTNSLKAEWKLYYCPMAPAYKFWVQPKAETKKMNPYMGLSMQQCGSLKPWPTIVSVLDGEES